MPHVDYRALRLAWSLGAVQAGEEHLRMAAEGLEPPAMPAPSPSGTRSGPSFHRAWGRAQGLALAAGRPVPEVDDVLRACGWTGPVADDLAAAAEAQAVRFGDGFVGPGHVVLARLTGLLGLDDYERRHVARVAGCEPRGSPPVAGRVPAPSPACLELFGRAEGLAAGLRAARVDAGHAAVAWLWQSHGTSVLELESLGTTGPATVDALAAAGVAVPALPLPEPDRRRWGEPVMVPADRYADIVRHLTRVLPAGDWGCNRAGDRAWVVALAGVDLRALVDRCRPKLI